jgi:hypothetical protein
MRTEMPSVTLGRVARSNLFKVCVSNVRVAETATLLADGPNAVAERNKLDTAETRVLPPTAPDKLRLPLIERYGVPAPRLTGATTLLQLG